MRLWRNEYGFRDIGGMYIGWYCYIKLDFECYINDRGEDVGYCKNRHDIRFHI